MVEVRRRRFPSSSSNLQWKFAAVDFLAQVQAYADDVYSWHVGQGRVQDSLKDSLFISSKKILPDP